MGCNYGSIWRKWDFHVHTPYSILNNNYGFNPFELKELNWRQHLTRLLRDCFLPPSKTILPLLELQITL